MSFLAFSGLVNGITCILLALFVLTKNWKSSVNRSYFLANLCVTLYSFGYFLWQLASDSHQALLYFRILTTGIILINQSYLYFVFTFVDILHRRRLLLLTCLIINLLFIGLNLSSLLYPSQLVLRYHWGFWPVPLPAFHVYLVFWVWQCLYGFAWLLRSYRESIGSKKEQVKYFLVAALFGFAGGATNWPLWYSIPFPPYLNILISVYVAIVAYAIARYRLLDINIAVTRTTVFAVVYALLLGVPLAGALAWQSQLERLLGYRWWVWAWVIGAILTTAAHYTNMYLQSRAEARLLREQRRYQATLLQASHGMTQIMELQRLLDLIVHVVARAVGLTHAAAFLAEEKEGGAFVLKAVRYQPSGSGTRVKPTDALIRLLIEEEEPIVREELASEVAGVPLKDEATFLKAQAAAQMKALNASVVVPSFRQEVLIGFLVLGEKRNGRSFTTEDLTVFSTLANQAAVAIENARFYEEEKQRQAALFHAATLASLGTMASSMGHQVNNRFNVVSVVSSSQKYKLKQVLAEGSQDPGVLRKALQDCQAGFQSLEEEAVKGGQIVASIRKLARPSGDEGHKPLPLTAAIQAGMDVVQHKVRFDAFDFHLDIPKDLPPVLGDLSQLGECFLNFIDNAYDSINTKAQWIREGRLRPANGPAPYRGSVRITARLKDPKTIRVEIADTGTGVDRETLGKLFVPFFTTKATAEKGTGLGLYVIKKVMEAHGGMIRAESTPGEGMVFTLELPVAAAEAAPAPKRA